MPKILFRSRMSRVLFNTYDVASTWKGCMDTCSKYNRAMAPSFKSQEEVEELIAWIFETTTDPITNLLYPEALGRALWIPFRFDQLLNQTSSFNSNDILFLVMSTMRDNGLIITQVLRLMTPTLAWCPKASKETRVRTAACCPTRGTAGWTSSATSLPSNR